MTTEARTVLKFKRKRVSDREWLIRSFVMRPCECYQHLNSTKPSADMRCMKCLHSFRSRVAGMKRTS